MGYLYPEQDSISGCILKGEETNATLDSSSGVISFSIVCCNGMLDTD